MNQEEMVMAALSTSKGKTFTPVQVQKMFFLIDRNISDQIGGPYFNFIPYDYGPFDAVVYGTLNILSIKGMVKIDLGGYCREYGLTENGQAEGEKILASLREEAQRYIMAVSDFVRRLTFSELIASIYKAYPEMKINSVFREEK